MATEKAKRKSASRAGEGGAMRRPEQGARRGRQPGDARGDAGELQKNRERLGVADDHRTGSMRRHRRGTYP